MERGRDRKRDGETERHQDMQRWRDRPWKRQRRGVGDRGRESATAGAQGERESNVGKTEPRRDLASGRDAGSRGTEPRGGDGRSPGDRAADCGRASGERVGCRGGPGAGCGGEEEGPSPPPIPGAAAAAAEFPSYQVTAGFASFSLARPQPIRRQRRCSRAGGPETRAPSPDTQRSTRTHNRSSSHTHTVPGTRSIAPTRAHHHRDTHTDVHTPGARRDPRHRGAHRIALGRHSPRTYTGTARTHNHNDTPYANTQPHPSDTCSLHDLVPRIHSVRDTHTITVTPS